MGYRCCGSCRDLSASHLLLVSVRYDLILKQLSIKPFACMCSPLSIPVNFPSHCTHDFAVYVVPGVAKCVVCGAYINRYCDVSYHRWACSVCGHRSGVLPAKVLIKIQYIESLLLIVTYFLCLPCRADLTCSRGIDQRSGSSLS